MNRSRSWVLEPPLVIGAPITEPLGAYPISPADSDLVLAPNMLILPFLLTFSPALASILHQSPLHVQETRKIPGGSPVQLCDVELPHLVDFEYLELDPNPPVRGTNLTFSASVFVQRPVETGAYVDVDVRYGYIRLLRQTFDLCELAPRVGLSCPIDKGPLHVKRQVEIPKEVPAGKYVVIARVYTVDDESLACLTAEVEFPVVR